MFKLVLLIVSIASFATTSILAQPDDSVRVKTILRQSVLPTSLIISGIAISSSQFEKDLQSSIRNSVGEDYYTKSDNYIWAVPIVELYLADIMKIKSKNHWFDQSKYLFISLGLATGITYGLKYTTNKIRPDGTDHSFPSGHTTLAFVNAEVLFSEFHSLSPVLAYSGYAFAITTGSLRVVNNKHWISDVVVGAGIGILLTRLVYHFEPLKSFNPFKKSHNISFIPTYNNSMAGFIFNYSF